MMQLPRAGVLVLLGTASSTLLALAACGGEPDVIPQFTSSSGGTGTTSSSSSSSGDVNTGKCTVGGDDACGQCQGTKCKAEAEACFCRPHENQTDNCDTFFNAQVDECAAPDAGTTCEADVEARFPQGVADSKAFDDCMAQSCASICAQ